MPKFNIVLHLMTYIERNASYEMQKAFLDCCDGNCYDEFTFLDVKELN